MTTTPKNLSGRVAVVAGGTRGAAAALPLSSASAMTMPPLPTWYRGRDAIAIFLEAEALTSDKRWRVVPVRANGQLAFGKYICDDERDSFTAHSLSVLTLDERDGIADFTTFLDPDLLPRFGLPDQLAPRNT